jgi:ATP-dependent Lhr-like helicase
MGGVFFAGIPGIQFIDPGQVGKFEGSPSSEGVFWINAVDPISLCGLGLEALKGELPSRLTTTHLVYRGAQLVLVSRRLGRRLEIQTTPDDPCLQQAFGFFFHLLRPPSAAKSIVIEVINGEPARQSAFADPLRAFGFERDYPGLRLWPRSRD